jgi:hypothetical protein
VPVYDGDFMTVFRQVEGGSRADHAGTQNEYLHASSPARPSGANSPAILARKQFHNACGTALRSLNAIQL